MGIFASGLVSRGAVVALAPFFTILVVLSAYLWPLDHAPTSAFSDIPLYHAPNVLLLSSSLQESGELPRWNRQDFAGVPTVSDPQVGLYNPVNWLLLLRPTLHSFGLLIVAFTLVGALGFMLYVRELGYSIAGAACGAITFCIGGKILMNLVQPGHVVMAPFFLVPLLLWRIERVAARPQPTTVITVSLLTALLLVSLHPQILFYSAWLILALALGAARRSEKPALAFGGLTLAAMLGVGAAAVQLLPVIALGDEFTRALPELQSLDAWEVSHPNDRVRLTQVVTGATSSWEARYYLGGVTLLFALIGLLAWPRASTQRGHAWLHGSLALIALLFALGPGAGAYSLLMQVPGFDLFRIPARALIIMGLPVALLVTSGVDALLQAPARRRLAAEIGAGAVVIAILLATGATVPQLSLFALALAALPCVHRLPRAGVLAVFAVIAVDTAGAVTPLVRTAPEAEIGSNPPQLLLPASDQGVFRIAEPRRHITLRGIPELEKRRQRLETLSGFNPLVPWRFLVYTAYASGYDPIGRNIADTVPVSRRRPKLFDVLGVTHFLYALDDEYPPWRWATSETALPRAYLVPGPIVAAEDVGDRMIAAEQTALAQLDEINPRTHVILHGETVQGALDSIGAVGSAALEPFREVPIAERSANRITIDVELSKPGILVLNEPFFPGWRAHANGKELMILRANVLFRAVALPPGSHAVEFCFAPLAWRIGRWISICSLGIMVLILLPAVRRRLGPH